MPTGRNAFGISPKRGIAVRWTDEELKKGGIDPDLWRSVFDKFAEAGGPPRPRFYEVPVENGGPTDLEIAAFRRYYYNVSQHAAGNPEYSSPYNKTYPAGCFIDNPKRGVGLIVRKPTAQWDDWKKEQAEIRAERVRLKKERRTLAERDAEEVGLTDLTDELDNLDIGGAGEDVLEDDAPLEHDAPLKPRRIDEPLPIDDAAQRLQSPAFMHSPLNNCVLLCVVKTVEQEADALKAKLREARELEEGYLDEEARMQHLYEEEYERRVEAEYVQDEQEKEVTRLNMEVLRLKGLFESVSLVTHDALNGN